MEWLVFRALRRRSLKKLAGSGVRVADRVYGHLQSGRVSEEYLMDLLGRLAGGINEVYLHPGARYAEPQRSWTGESGDVELDALQSPAVRERIESMGIRLTTFRDLT